MRDDRLNRPGAGWRDPRFRSLLLTAASATGYGVAVAALVLLLRHNGGLAFDARAYWLAGRNVLGGAPLYAPVSIDALGAYFYPPIFAQLWAPFSILPELAFAWLWRLVCIGCLRFLAGSWKNVGLWFLVPLTITEISAANVTFPVAAMTLLALRGKSWLAPWAAALKIGPIVALPYLWLTRPAERRTLVAGTLALIAACAVSFLLAPGYWFDYAGALGRQSGSLLNGAGLIAILPTAQLDFALRLGLALALIAIAIARRSDGIAFAATVIAAPTLWVQRLTPLLVLPRLRDGDRDRDVAESREVADRAPDRGQPASALGGSLPHSLARFFRGARSS